MRQQVRRVDRIDGQRNDEILHAMGEHVGHEFALQSGITVDQVQAFEEMRFDPVLDGAEPGVDAEQHAVDAEALQLTRHDDGGGAFPDADLRHGARPHPADGFGKIMVRFAPALGVHLVEMARETGEGVAAAPDRSDVMVPEIAHMSTRYVS